MGQRFRQWRALPAADRNTVLAMMLALPIISQALRMFGYLRLRHWIERMSAHNTASRSASAEDIVHGERLTRLAAIAGRHGVVEATCLRQALLVYGLLRRDGLAPELRFGARREGDAIAAHAWLELDGRALEQGTSRHAAFPTTTG